MKLTKNLLSFVAFVFAIGAVFAANVTPTTGQVYVTVAGLCTLQQGVTPPIECNLSSGEICQMEGKNIFKDDQCATPYFRPS